MRSIPIVKDVVLVGGGHSHALLLRQWAMQPIPGVRITLISQAVLTPYSGMLPGLIAGHYTAADIHIDLARVCHWAGVRFIEAYVTGIDLQRNLVQLAYRPAVGFDVLSLDTGSTPDLSVPGAAQFTTPVKPVYAFYSRWMKIKARLDTHAQHITLGVVGSGAGGFELIMAMRHALATDRCTCHWFLRGEHAIAGRPPRVGALALTAAEAAGVVVHRNFNVTEVQSKGLNSEDGRFVKIDEILWCAAASAPSWPARAGLETDERGFVATNRYLQSRSHPTVFATGDIGTQLDSPSDKAGVFAVRQAPVLFANIRRLLLSKNLKPFVPQRDFLSLMATGKKAAIASRGPFALSASWIWRWKDHIDQKFMDQFRCLSAMRPPKSVFQLPAALLKGTDLEPTEVNSETMRCAGCGAKVGAGILHDVLSEIAPFQRTGVLSGVSQCDDSAVFEITDGALVQSVDQLSAIVEDPYVFGYIAAVHALSDVFTRKAVLHSAQAIVGVPFAADAIVRRDLHQLMSGAVAALNSEQCSLIGGHTAESSELQVGFVVNALLSVPPSLLSANSAPVNAGDKLILTKPIGSGVLFAGFMQTRARGVDIHAAILSMKQSNRQAAELLFSHEVLLLTDVTGFGLLGHCHQLFSAISLKAHFDLNKIPVFDGVLELAERGST